MKINAQMTDSSFALSAMKLTDWYVLALVIAVATGLRILFYTGFFGSDEVTYVETAANIAAGDWRVSNYIGATRYGMNLPVALSIYIFGLSETAANAWPFFCSVGEVALLFIAARWLWNTRTAILGAGLLAVLPLHVHFAGRLMADSPLALFLTLSAVLLLRGATSKNWLLFLLTGLAWGGVFWIKESVGLLYAPVLLILAVYLNRINNRLLWLCAGMVLGVAANCVLMYLLTGNLLHLFSVMKTNLVAFATDSSGISSLTTSPSFYFRYLFFDIRHTFSLGFLVAAGILLFCKNSFNGTGNSSSTKFVVLWAFLLVGMFSFAIVSFSSIKFVLKQTNYMLIFVGPLALLAGWFLASLSNRILMPLGAFILSGSLVLAALEQQAIMVFTANSKAVYTLLRTQPNVFVLGTTNNQRAINFYGLLENQRGLSNRIMSFADFLNSDKSTQNSKKNSNMIDKKVFAVIDLQNISWGNKGSAIRGLSDVPKCWDQIGILPPAPLGSGQLVGMVFLAAGNLLPASMKNHYDSIGKSVIEPLPAYLFQIGQSCVQ